MKGFTYLLTYLLTDKGIHRGAPLLKTQEFIILVQALFLKPYTINIILCIESSVEPDNGIVPFYILFVYDNHRIKIKV